MMQFDAKAIRCPDYSLVVRGFLNTVPDNERAHIVTREPRALKRMEHICSVYEWQLDVSQNNDDIHFMVTKKKD